MEGNLSVNVVHSDADGGGEGDALVCWAEDDVIFDARFLYASRRNDIHILRRDIQYLRAVQASHSI